MTEQKLDYAAALLAANDEDRFDAELAATAISAALECGDHATLSSWFNDTLAADTAEALGHLEPSQIAAALPLMSDNERARVFGYLPLPQQADLVAVMQRAAIVDLFDHMSSDERADLYNALPESRRERLLPALAQVEREDIRRLASYERDTAGSIMSSDYATLAPHLTMREAIEELRRVAPDTETIYNAYVVDSDRRLIGVVTLRRLITAAADATVAELMETNPVTAYVDDDQETVAEKISRYDFIALPILDRNERLVGIVTADDAMDVAAAEATEDFHKAGGSLGRFGVSMKEATIGVLYRKRIFWLLLLVFGNIFSGAGIAHFEDLIAANIALVFFLPLLIDSGGNAGSQSATLMVRALATGDVVMRDWAGMILRELGVAGLLGLTMALAVSGLGLIRGGAEVALVVALSMQIIVIAGSVIGMSLPFLLSRLRADPASASAPLITSICDAGGILIYFAVASALLPGLVAS